MSLQNFRWSVLDRSKDLERAVNEKFDLIIVGGGITGAGIAREASLRNLKFIMIDKSDFAFGTSSKSSKLAHGGFRYLANKDFKLVRESTTERNWMRVSLPNLVRPLAFNMYSMTEGTYSPKKIKIGVTLYDFLSDFGSKYKNYAKYSIYTPEQLFQHEPKLRQDGMVMGGQYYDTNVDDARLTIETIKEALFLSKNQSLALNYVKMQTIIKNEAGKAIGIQVTDELEHKKFEIKGTQIINATGIWTDEFLQNPESNKLIRPTKGSHIIIRNDRLGNNNAFGVVSIDDKRFYFILRREKFTVIGTTDTDFKENLDHPVCTKEDCDYLFHTVNYLFPDAKLTYEDIVSTYAGVRPLVMEQGKAESKVSRKHVIMDHPDGVVSLIGGKLTIFRLMGEQLIFHLVKAGVFPNIPKKTLKKGFSQQPYLVGMTREAFDQKYSTGMANSTYPKLDADLLEYLHREYGTQAFEIMELIKKDPAKGSRFITENEFIPAEMEWICDHEYAPKLMDVLCRRTEAWIFVHHKKSLEIATKVADIMAKKYGWSEARKATEIKEYVDFQKSWLWF